MKRWVLPPLSRGKGARLLESSALSEVVWRGAGSCSRSRTAQTRPSVKVHLLTRLFFFIWRLNHHSSSRGRLVLIPRPAPPCQSSLRTGLTCVTGPAERVEHRLHLRGLRLLLRQPLLRAGRQRRGAALEQPLVVVRALVQEAAAAVLCVLR